MSRRVLPIVFLAALCVPGCQTADNFTMGGQDTPSPIGKTQKWSFDGSSVGELPTDFIPVLGVWSVAAEGSAPSSPNVLRQTGGYGDPDFPRVLYRVIARNREVFQSANVPVTAGQWHTLEATAVGDLITISWDGTQVITANDQTYTNGKIGLWTKADSVTAFDDLEATAQ